MAQASTNTTYLQSPSPSTTHASSSQESPSTHPLTQDTLSMLSAIQQQEEGDRIARLQQAARDLGFNLSSECFENGKVDLNGWLEGQPKTYNSAASNGRDEKLEE